MLKEEVPGGARKFLQDKETLLGKDLTNDYGFLGLLKISKMRFFQKKCVTSWTVYPALSFFPVHDFIFNSAYDDQGDLIGCFTERVLTEHKLCQMIHVT